MPPPPLKTHIATPHTHPQYQDTKRRTKASHSIHEANVHIAHVLCEKSETPQTQRPPTCLVLGFLVGAGIEQKPHAVCVTTGSGPNQCGRSDLRVAFAKSVKHTHTHTPTVQITSNDTKEDSDLYQNRGNIVDLDGAQVLSLSSSLYTHNHGAHDL